MADKKAQEKKPTIIPLIENIPEQIQKGDQCFELHYDFSRDYSLQSIISAFISVVGVSDEETQINKDYIPVITSVKHINSDLIEIKRAIIFRKFYNSLPYPEETIRIDRSKLNKKPSDIVYESFLDIGMKQELTRLFAFGFLSKRQLLNLDAHKAFSSVKNIQIMSDIYMYKNLKECNAIYKILEPRQKLKISKDDLKELRLSDLVDLI